MAKLYRKETAMEPSSKKLLGRARPGDVAHASVPYLPTLLDGLRAQEVIAAARRSEQERRWVDL